MSTARHSPARLIDLTLIVLLAPVLVAALLVVGVWSGLHLSMQRLTGRRDSGELVRMAYHPGFERFGQRPAI